MQNSEKRVALVTGANKGIGSETARQLAAKDLARWAIVAWSQSFNENIFVK